MNIQIVAVGRLRKGPELALFTDYADRFNKTGRPLGLGPLKIHEVEDKKGIGAAAEADLIWRSTPQGGRVIALDERGTVRSSPKFAQTLQTFADQGVPNLTFWIGGADGFTDDMRGRADALLSFGAMVWPHMLARVMLCEQLYRAASILAGKPYHRG